MRTRAERREPKDQSRENLINIFLRGSMSALSFPNPEANLLKLSSECLVSYDPHFFGNDGTNEGINFVCMFQCKERVVTVQTED